MNLHNDDYSCISVPNLTYLNRTGKVTWSQNSSHFEKSLESQKIFFHYKTLPTLPPSNLQANTANFPNKPVTLSSNETGSDKTGTHFNQTKGPPQYTKVTAILKILTLRPIDLTQSSLFNKTAQWIALKRRYLVDNTMINKSLPSRCNQVCMNTVMLSATPMDRSDLSSVWQLSLARSIRRSQTTADAWARTGSWYQCSRRSGGGRTMLVVWSRQLGPQQRVINAGTHRLSNPSVLTGKTLSTSWSPVVSSYCRYRKAFLEMGAA